MRAFFFSFLSFFFIFSLFFFPIFSLYVFLSIFSSYFFYFFPFYFYFPFFPLWKVNWHSTGRLQTICPAKPFESDDAEGLWSLRVGGTVVDALCFLLEAVSGKHIPTAKIWRCFAFSLKHPWQGWLVGGGGLAAEKKKTSNEPQVTQRDENLLWFNISLMVKHGFVCQGFGTAVGQGTAWAEVQVYL